MKSKIVQNFRYEGLGFPIGLENVELININGEWIPKIDVRWVADEAIKKLAVQESRLTGNQIKFIRSYFSMPLREFSEKIIHATHTAVNKWEKAGNEITNMNANTEQVLRLFIIEQTQEKTENSYADFYNNFQKSKLFFNKKDKKLEPFHIKLLSRAG